jgi:hypothetical protein
VFLKFTNEDKNSNYLPNLQIAASKIAISLSVHFSNYYYNKENQMANHFAMGKQGCLKYPGKANYIRCLVRTVFLGLSFAIIQ